MKSNLKRVVFILFCLILIVLIGLIVFVKNVDIGKATLNWNPAEETNFKGYRVYYGEKPRTADCPPEGYENMVDVGPNNKFEIGKLKNDATYYFSVTTYDQNDKESCYSEEVKKTISVDYFSEIKKLILRE